MERPARPFAGEGTRTRTHTLTVLNGSDSHVLGAGLTCCPGRKEPLTEPTQISGPGEAGPPTRAAKHL